MTVCKSPRDVGRQAKWCELYRQGQTLQQIGDAYGLTRERVRQVIAATGISARDGGLHAQAEARRKQAKTEAKNRRDARALLYYGCSRDELLALNEGMAVRDHASPAGRFRNQKNNSRHRGIVWAITFPQWMAAWLESGHWGDRGRHAEGYVMARKGDTGPYTIGNIYITTLAQNVVDYQATLKRRGVECVDGYRRLPEKSSRVSSKDHKRHSPLGTGRGWTMKGRRFQVVARNKYIGTFPTAGEAHAAYRKACAAMRKEG